MNGQPNKNGEKSLEQNFPHNQKEMLEAQIRECYGRVVYSHKTHEKCSDILLERNASIKLWQVILSAITTGSLLVTVFGDGKGGAIIATFFSTILLALNTYTKDFQLVEIAEKHKTAAHNLWEIRESYLSLLTDFAILSIEEIMAKRDELQDRLSKVYQGSPRTNFKAYSKARGSLKDQEEMTFAEKELDLLLPTRLRKNKE